MWFPQDPVHFQRSAEHEEQSSASSIILFQQNAVQEPTSLEQVVQLSPSSMMPFQHSHVQGITHASLASSAQV
ncbi:hypothetical protein IJU97_05480 [bacterium]|nr:hypothetical protein [bacterium]